LGGRRRARGDRPRRARDELRVLRLDALRDRDEGRRDRGVAADGLALGCRDRRDRGSAAVPGLALGGLRVARARKPRRSTRLAGRRAAAGAVAGAAGIGVAFGAGASWPVAVLVGWSAAAAVYLGWVWSTVGRLDPVETR